MNNHIGRSGDEALVVVLLLATDQPFEGVNDTPPGGKSHDSGQWPELCGDGPPSPGPGGGLAIQGAGAQHHPADAGAPLRTQVAPSSRICVSRSISCLASECEIYYIF